ncbi:hypothetical protein BYT27DRAFT_7212916 [Phlegmacium glaucopus]|nr:hypothetical protein BYT27DRAFT_7212916 [Phlegmacium glaucopus]
MASSTHPNPFTSNNIQNSENPWILEGCVTVVGPNDQRYLVPGFMLPAMHQLFDGHRKKEELKAFGASGTVHQFASQLFDIIGEGKIMMPTVPGSSDRERLAAHSEVLALQERLGISYKDAAHQLYMAELEGIKAEQKIMPGINQHSCCQTAGLLSTGMPTITRHACDYPACLLLPGILAINRHSHYELAGLLSPGMLSVTRHAYAPAFLLSNSMHALNWRARYPPACLQIPGILAITRHSFYQPAYLLSTSRPAINQHAWHPPAFLLSTGILVINRHAWSQLACSLSTGIPVINRQAWHQPACIQSPGIIEVYQLACLLSCGILGIHRHPRDQPHWSYQQTVPLGPLLYPTSSAGRDQRHLPVDTGPAYKYTQHLMVPSVFRESVSFDTPCCIRGFTGPREPVSFNTCPYVQWTPSRVK